MCDTMERGPARTAPVIRDTGGQRSEVGKEIERTVDMNKFRGYESIEEENRGATSRHDIDFWEVSEQGPSERNSSSRSSSVLDLEQVLRQLTEGTNENFRRPRYTEFRKEDRKFMPAD